MNNPSEPLLGYALNKSTSSINVPDWKNTLEVTTNTTKIFEEDDNEDNTIKIDFEISDRTNLNNVILRKPRDPN